MAVTSNLCHVLVAYSDGCLHALDFVHGTLVAQLDCQGGLRGTPSIDPWKGYAWQATHGKQLWVIALQHLKPEQTQEHEAERMGASAQFDGGSTDMDMHSADAQLTCVAQVPLPAASSCAVVFDAAARQLYLACLDGTVMAFQVTAGQSGRTAECQEAAASSTAVRSARRTGDGSCGDSWLESGAAAFTGAESPISRHCTAPDPAVVSTVWSYKAQAPLFSTPAVCPDSGNLLMCSVHGGLACLARDSGRALWQLQLDGGHVFADITLNYVYSQRHSPKSGCAVRGNAVALLATHASLVYCIDCASGRRHWVVDLAAGPLSSPAIVMHNIASCSVVAQNKPPGPGEYHHSPRSSQDMCGMVGGAAVLVCSDNGALCEISHPSWHDDSIFGQLCGGNRPGGKACIKFPQPVHSSPVALGQYLVCGSRDDCLYCLKRLQ